MKRYAPSGDDNWGGLKQFGYGLLMVAPFIAVFAYGARTLVGPRSAAWLGVGIFAVAVVAYGSVVVASLAGSVVFDATMAILKYVRVRGSQTMMPRDTPIPLSPMTNKRKVSTDEARSVGTRLGINWGTVDIEQFRRGLEVEFEHGAHDPETNVTGDDPILTGKIAWAHLKEFPDYYARLDKLEAEADAYWATRR
jgi:hypothetical protein